MKNEIHGSFVLELTLTTVPKPLVLLAVMLLASSSARAEAPVVAVDRTFSNPTVLDVAHARPTERITGKEPFDCWMTMTTAEPLARFDVAAPTHLAMWVHGAESARALALTHDGVLAQCIPHTRTGAHTVDATFAPGAWEVRLAYVAGERQLPARVRIDVSEPDRRNDYDSEGVTKVDVTTATTPVVVAGIVDAERVWGGRGCDRGVSFARMPDLYLTSTRPLAGVEVRALEPGLAVHVHGPLESTGFAWAPCDRVAPTWRAAGFRGTYAVFVGDVEGAARRTFDLLVTHDRMARDPLFVVPPPGNLSVAERVLERHLPFLDTGKDLEARDAAARERLTRLFATLPKALFVAPKEDLAPGFAAPHWRGEGYAILAHGEPLVDPEGKAPTFPDDAFPLRGEPLLVLEVLPNGGVVVATADGLLFSTSPAGLATSPPPEPVLPEVPRAARVPLDLDALVALAPAGSDKLAEPYHRVADRYDACIERAFAAYGSGASDNGVWRVHWDGHTFSYDEISDEIEERAIAQCGGAAVEKAYRQAWKAIGRRYGEALTAQLDSIRRRFAERSQ